MNKRHYLQYFDFYAENKRDFEQKFSHASVLVQGRHREPAPLVTILLTTYKRPEVLRMSLESALNQSGFDDYQIIIVDNEGADTAVETETSRLVSGYRDEKVIYYRHEKSVNFKMDSAVRLARSKWICFLHDDDILASNHLAVMVSIVKKHRRIRFLSGGIKPFENDITMADFEEITRPHPLSYQVKKYPRAYACLGYFPSWLGALIDREAYISTGGMPTLSNNIGDYCMVGKFHYRYGVYAMVSDTPLYFYRRWTGQVSAGKTEMRRKMYIAEYSYHVYVTAVYHKFFRDFWNRISAYRILDKCHAANRSVYHTQIDLEGLVMDCHMPEDILDKGRRYQKDMVFQILYESLVEKIYKPVRYTGSVGAEVWQG